MSELPEQQQVAEEAPVKKTTRRRAAAPAAESVAPEAVETLSQEAKPKRVRTRKVAAAEPGEALEVVAEPSAEAPAKPRRASRARASAKVEAEGGAEVVAEQGPVGGAPEAEAVSEEEARARRRGPRELREAREREEKKAQKAIAREAQASGDEAVAPQADAADAAGVEGGAVEGVAKESDGRRGRRDRRDRRDRAGKVDRPERQGAPGAESAEPLPAGISAEELFALVTSEAFDDEVAEDATPQEPAKRVLEPQPDAPKLHKVLAQAGVGSRRDMEQIIADGRVTVNGEAAHTGQRVQWGDKVRLDGKELRIRITPPLPRILAYHKPAGEVVSHDDPQNRPTVFRRLPRLQSGKWMSVGRLDLNTEGLLLFTNSGELANQLMHPRFNVEREYAVRVLGTLEEGQRATLLDGVDIEGQRAQFKSIEDGGGEGVNRWYRVVITEGRNREVRKLFAAVGLTVSRLIRIRYGSVVLPRGLKRGVYVELDRRDVEDVRRIAAQPAPRGERAEGGEREERGGRGRPAKQGQGQGQQGKQGRQQGKPQGKGQQAAQPQGKGRGGRGDERIFDRPARDEQPKRGQGKQRPSGVDREDRLTRQPDPLEQTYDKRFAQRNQRQGSTRQPDPLQTSLGYIGADTFYKKMNGGGGGGGRRGRR